MIDIFAEYGIIGLMAMMFAGQMAWLQKVLTQKLLDQYQILIKLIDRFNKSDDSYDKWQDKIIENAERRHESLLKEINDLTDDVNYIKGTISRMNGKH
ncbi:hypothetical protein [uncultured Mediterranean phage uvMED]|nr:hypothetical protein [uncultured Mediterranean phage uvMED]|tara:strand:- start:928 stop:1221 length:294 start_codon:yes stop_codon:yes gene_type:complete